MISPLYNTNAHFYCYLFTNSDMGLGRMDLDTQMHGVTVTIIRRPFPP